MTMAMTEKLTSFSFSTFSSFLVFPRTASPRTSSFGPQSSLATANLHTPGEAARLVMRWSPAIFGLVCYVLHWSNHVDRFILISCLLGLHVTLFALDKYGDADAGETVPSAAYATALFFIFNLTAIVFHRALCHPLNRIPGPWLARFTKIWMLPEAVRGNRHWALLKLHRKYGDYVRIGPNEVSSIDMKHFLEIYKNNSKGPFYDTLPIIKGSIRSLGDLRDKAEHARRRRVWDAAFSKSALESYEITTRTKAHDICEGILRRGATGAVDLRREFSYFTWTMMYHLSFGSKGHDLVETGPDSRWDAIFDAMEKFMRMFVILSVCPWFLHIAPHLRPDKAVVRFVEDMRKLYEARVSDPTISGDVFSFFLAGIAAAPTEAEKKRRTCEAEADAGLLIAAGADTILTTVTHLFFYLLTEPGRATYLELQKQIDTAFGQGGEVRNTDLAERCPLLDACINESLRLIPPVPGGMERDVPKAGTVLGPYFMPHGTHVTMPHLAIGRDPRNFKKPNTFRPRRWLDGEEMNRDAFQPFSIGPQSCVGRHLAMQELRLLTAWTLHKMDLDLVQPFDAAAFEKAQNDFFTVHLPEPLPVRVTPRN